MNPETQTFAENLKLIRKGRGLSQTQLAEKIGLTKQSIINYEKGSTFPTGNRLTKLFEVLEVTPEQLLGSENIQLESEKELLKEIKEKSYFLSHYDIMVEHFQDEIFQYFLDNLSKFSETELKQAILYTYNQRIEKKEAIYSEELAQQITNSAESSQTSLLDKDLRIGFQNE